LYVFEDRLPHFLDSNDAVEINIVDLFMPREVRLIMIKDDLKLKYLTDFV